MKLSALVTFLFSTSVSAAAFGWTPGNDQVHLKEEFNVPGANPLLFCEDPKDNSLTIDNVDLDPNPPKAYVYPIVCGKRSQRKSPYQS